MVLSASASTIVGDWTVMDNNMVDDGVATFSTTGTWGDTSGAIPAADDGWKTGSPHDPGTGLTDPTYLFSDDGTATWTFLGLADGTYEVAVSFREFSNRPTDAFYSVQGGSAITVDQTSPPTGTPTLNDGVIDVPFQVLTSTAIVSGGSGNLTVMVSEGTPAASEFLIADAAAIRAIPEPSSTALLGLGGLTLLLRRRK